MNRLLLWLGLPHHYRSTGCLHGGRNHDALPHRYCRGEDGINGRKKPASCKWCGTECRCRCHRKRDKNA